MSVTPPNNPNTPIRPPQNFSPPTPAKRARDVYGSSSSQSFLGMRIANIVADNQFAIARNDAFQEQALQPVNSLDSVQNASRIFWANALEHIAENDDGEEDFNQNQLDLSVDQEEQPIQPIARRLHFAGADGMPYYEEYDGFTPAQLQTPVPIDFNPIDDAADRVPSINDSRTESSISLLSNFSRNSVMSDRSVNSIVSNLDSELAARDSDFESEQDELDPVGDIDIYNDSDADDLN